jgi:hypothetical protein
VREVETRRRATRKNYGKLSASTTRINRITQQQHTSSMLILIVANFL